MYFGWEVTGAVKTVYITVTDDPKPQQHWKLINFGVDS
jgi:hypothetical protein